MKKIISPLLFFTLYITSQGLLYCMESKILFFNAIGKHHKKNIESLIKKDRSLLMSTIESENEGLFQILTPLTGAIFKGNTATALFLIKAGADVNKPYLWFTKNPYNIVLQYTPLLLAIALNENNKFLKVIQEIINHKGDINATDESGMTPLMIAASLHAKEVVEILLAHHADTMLQLSKDMQNVLIDKNIEITLTAGSTALEIAQYLQAKITNLNEKKRYDEIIVLLKKYQETKPHKSESNTLLKSLNNLRNNLISIQSKLK